MRRVCLLLVLVCLAAGCEVPPTPDTPVSYHLETDPASGRAYFLYVPSTYREDRAIPVVITCHGTPPFDVAEHHIREWKWYGEQNGMIVIAPTLEATDGILGDGPLVGMIANERYILSILSSLSYRYNIDRANVMIDGFSGGGFPAYWVGLRHPDIFSCVSARNCNFSEGNLDGWYPPEATTVNVLVLFGENDPGAIVHQSQNAIRFLASRGFTVEKLMVPGLGHQRRPDLAVEFFRRHFRPSRPSFPTGARTASYMD